MVSAHSSRRPPLQDIDIAILAGGFGTRIRGILGDTPKALAPVGGRPFLALLLDKLRGFGARRVVLCLGVGAPAIQRYLAEAPVQGLEIVTVVETEPLGTAGAIRLCASVLQSDPVLVMNGDSFVDADLGAFVRHHEQSGLEGAILCCRVDDGRRYGTIQIVDGTVIGFAEKAPLAGPSVINAGVYAFSQRLLARVAAAGATSLERDFFAKLPPGTLGAFVADGRFIDIGTPDSLADAERVLAPFLDGRPHDR